MPRTTSSLVTVRRLLVPLVVMAALAVLSHGLRADGAWSLDAPAPAALAEVAVAAVDGTAYVVGGSSATAAVNSLYAFNPLSHAWAPRASYPGAARDHMAATALDGALYVAGGLSALPGPSVATFQRYNPGANTWTSLAPMPRARAAFGLAAVNGRIYAVGGVVSHDDPDALTDLAEYDPATNTWVARAPLPTARDHVAAVALNGRLYVVGGRPGGDAVCAPLTTVEVYDPTTDAWSTAAGLAAARAGHALAVAHGRILAFGGDGAAGDCGPNSLVEEFDPLSNAWRQLTPMPQPRYGMGAAAIENMVYLPVGKVAGGTRVTSNDRFDPAATPPPPESLPAPWTSQDVGATGTAGSASHSNGTFTVRGAGADIWGAADAFHYASQPLAGDGTITARVTSLQNTDPYAKAGLMVRENLTAGSRHVILDVKPGGGVEFMMRSASSGATTFIAGGSATFPAWLRLTRSGNTFVGAHSANGTTWTEIGRVTLTLPAGLNVGFAVTSHTTTALATAMFDTVTVSGQPANLPPSVTLTAPSNGQSFAAPGPIALAATAADSDGQVAGVEFFSGSTSLGSDSTSPYGVTWNSVPAGTHTLTAVATDNAGNRTTSAAVTITVTAGSNPVPPPWTAQDIGSTGKAGSTSFTSGLFTVSAAGADIWGNTDSFHFVHQLVGGTLQLTARIASLQNTHPYAKSGVMLRESLAAGSAHVLLDVTPSGTIELLSRSATGAATTYLGGFSVGFPAWLRLTRSANTVIALASSNGSSWSEVGRLTITLPSSLYAGLAVTSHNTAALATSTVDNVSLTGEAANLPPSVTLAAPAAGAVYAAPGPVTFEASATDSDGTIAKVEFLSGATTLGSATTAPYTFVWNSGTAGTHTITAAATDNSGNRTTSAPVSITLTTPATSGLPTPWARQDVGTVGQAGSASYSNGAFTVRGAGADIWGTADGFHYVFRPLSGDGRIVARIDSFQAAHGSAKVGVMFRASLGASAVHAVLDLLPGGGVEYLTRKSTGALTEVYGAGAVSYPEWVRLTRTQNTFTAETSGDGQNWSYVGTVVLPMPATAYVGLIVTSHNTSSLATGVFSNVSVSEIAPPPPSSLTFNTRTLAVSGSTSGGAAGVPGLYGPTSLQYGPDGRLYVASISGMLYALTLDPETLTDPARVGVRAVQPIDAVFLKPSRTCNIGGNPYNCSAPSGTGRQVTGILAVAGPNAGDTTLYVSNSAPGTGESADPSIDTRSGTITRLVLTPDTSTTNPDDLRVSSAQDLVVGLPRSREAHTINGLSLGPDGWLYLAVGGHTNAGQPSQFFANLAEYYLSAAVVRLNLGALGGRSLPIDVSAISSASALAPLAGVFELYATGYRNAYDLTWHSNGRLYLNDNAANFSEGNTPGTADGCATPSISPGNRPDDLNLVTRGAYGGHPNPLRGECVFDDGAIYTPPRSPEAPFVAPLLSYDNGSSTNGIVEYTSDAFGGAMKGNLVSATYAGNQNVRRVVLDSTGTTVVKEENLGQFAQPLDVTADPAGNIYVAEYGAHRITMLVPGSLGTCPVPGDPTVVDSDADGFTDADETANGTDPCSPASRPPDFDGDGVSNLTDADDDNDGITDVQDQLFFDAQNGASTQLPLGFEYDPTSPPGGHVANSGFTGVQIASSGVRLDASAIKSGDAGGHISMTTASGTAEGAANSQVNALQVGFDSTSAFHISTEIVQPFTTTSPASGHVGGLFFGPGQDAFFRLGLAGINGGGLLVHAGMEVGGAFTTSAAVDLAGPVSAVALHIVGDPSARTVSAYYELNRSGVLATLAERVTIPAGWFSNNSGSAANTSMTGLMTSHGAAPQTGFGFAYFRIDRTLPPPPPPPAPPAAPSSPIPSNGATAVSTATALVWAASSGASSYDVAFGTSNPPPTVASAQAATTYEPSAPLAQGTTYYWRVTANGVGGSTSGPVWQFTTADSPPPPPPASTPLRRLRTLTWHVNGGRDRGGVSNVDAQVSLLARSGAQVIALQGVTAGTSGDLFVQYRDKLSAATGVTWNVVAVEDPRSAEQQAEGNLLLTTLPIAEASRAQFDAAPAQPALLDAKRSAARATVIVNGVRVTVSTTQLGLDPALRRVQLDQLQAWLGTIDAPRLVGGTFNMRVEDASYTDMAGSYRDVWSALVPTDDQGATTERFGALDAPARVDQWWQETNDTRARATEVWVIKTGRSSHHAVVAEVEVK